MNKKNLLLLFCFLIFGFATFAQKEKEPKVKKQKKEKPRKEKPIRTNAIYLQVPVPYLKLDFKDAIGGKHLVFEPSPQYNLGVGIKLGGFNLSFSTGVAVYKQNLAVKGKSQYRDIQIQINTKSFCHDFYYQNFKGFFVRNTSNYINMPSSNPYLLRPDLRFTLFGFNTLYILNNEKFSFKNTFGFNTLNRRYGGSFLVGAYYSSLGEVSDSGIVSSQFKNNFDSSSYYIRNTEQTYGVNVGYGFMVVILKRLHVTLSVAEGFGLYDIKYALENGTSFSSPSSFATKTNIRLFLGYDLGRVFVGGACNYDTYSLKNKSYSTTNYSNGKFRVFIGYRIGRQRTKE